MIESYYMSTRPRFTCGLYTHEVKPLVLCNSNSWRECFSSLISWVTFGFYVPVPLTRLNLTGSVKLS